MISARSRRVRLALAGAGLVACAALLRLLASGVLAPPPLDPAAWTGWVDERGAADAAMGLLRAGTELAVWYLVIATAVHALRGREPSSTTLLARATRPGARLVFATLGLPLIASDGALPGLDPSPPADDDAATAVAGPQLAPRMVRLDGETDTDAAASAPMMTLLDDAAISNGSTATATPQPGEASTATATPGSRPATPPRPTLAGRRDAASEDEPAPPQTWRVTAGDSFWVIAEEHVAEWRPAAGADDVARYWRALVDANRDRLADPDDPDLIFAGQVFDLPPFETAPVDVQA